MSVISTTTSLAASASFTSAVQFVQRATQITGTVYADQAGTLKIQQSGDQINWDAVTSYAITGGTGLGFEVDIVSQWWRIVYTNGTTAQTIFRLYADPRDPYGDFLAAALAPSPGGAYAVLVFNTSGTYTYLGRFAGADGFNANQNAAIAQNASGKYASFSVNTATVSDETIIKTTQHAPDSF